LETFRQWGDDEQGTGRQQEDHGTAHEREDQLSDGSGDSDEHGALIGTLRTPWKWEELLVEAAVIGGSERWRRRLRGLEAEYRLRIEELHYELECCRELLNERGIEGYLRRTRKEEPK